MSGWMFVNKQSLFGTIDIDKFKTSFSADNFGEPFCRIQKMDCMNKFISWAWKDGAFTDTAFLYDSNEGNAWGLFGYLLNFGRFGSAAGETVENLKKLISLIKNNDSDEIVAEMNGSFSILNSDMRSNKIIIYTDRIASRSVWFSCQRGERIIANIPATILPFMTEKPKINTAGLWSLLATHRHVGSQGIFQGFHNLQGGQKAVLEAEGTLKVTDWYSRRYSPEYGKTPRQWGGLIAEALRSSAGKHKKVTASPYLFLSGGLDSRLVAGAYGRELKTITLTTRPNMNSKISEKVARHLHLDHRTIIRTPYWYLDTFKVSAFIASGNYNIAHSHFIVPIKQVLESDHQAAFYLGDLLENFNKHYFKSDDVDLAAMKAQDVPDSFHKLFGFTHKEPKSLKKLFKNDVSDRAYEEWREALIASYRRIETVSEFIEDRLDSLFRWSNTSLCPTYLMLECMLPFARIRNLMFDIELQDLLLRIPASLRGARKLHQWTLWHLDKRLALIPDSNFWLPPVVPYKIQKLSRAIRPLVGSTRRRMVSVYRKKPVALTEGSWNMNHVLYRNDTKYRDYIRNNITNSNSVFMEFLDEGFIRYVWSKFLAGEDWRRKEIEVLLSLFAS